jgi:DNA polymerase I
VDLEHFSEVVVLDFEYGTDTRGRPVPVCLVAEELRSGRIHRLWRDDLLVMPEPPFPVDDAVLLVAFVATAELGCFIELGWSNAGHVVDLYVEFRAHTNGLANPFGNGLAGALSYLGLPSSDACAKRRMQEMIAASSDFNDEERDAVLAYCEEDVRMTTKLLKRLWPIIDWPRALIRGLYMNCAASIEACGVPVDVNLIRRLAEVRDDIVLSLKASSEFYQHGHLSLERVGDHIRRQHAQWPLTPTGKLKLDVDTLDTYAPHDPAISSFKRLQETLGQLRGEGVHAGSDGRSRALLWAFSSKTGRNQPSTAKFIFAATKWNRHAIQPADGHSLAYLDFVAQELGIAAALSGDVRMKRMYCQEDPYLDFARMAAGVPAAATKASHPRERAIYKTCGLGVNYAMGVTTLALRTQQTESQARALLDLHRQLFPAFWRWSERIINDARLRGVIQTAFGWPLHVTQETSDTTLRNFPMQANGAEIMRLVCIFARQAGVCICAPVHDGFLIESKTGELRSAIASMEHAMDRASELVLDGFKLRHTVDVIVHGPEHCPIDDEAMGTWLQIVPFLGADV